MSACATADGAVELGVAGDAQGESPVDGRLELDQVAGFGRVARERDRAGVGLVAGGRDACTEGRGSGDRDRRERCATADGSVELGVAGDAEVGSPVDGRLELDEVAGFGRAAGERHGAGVGLVAGGRDVRAERRCSGHRERRERCGPDGAVELSFAGDGQVESAVDGRLELDAARILSLRKRRVAGQAYGAGVRLVAAGGESAVEGCVSGDGQRIECRATADGSVELGAATDGQVRRAVYRRPGGERGLAARELQRGRSERCRAGVGLRTTRADVRVDRGRSGGRNRGELNCATHGAVELGGAGQSQSGASVDSRVERHLPGSACRRQRRGPGQADRVRVGLRRGRRDRAGKARGSVDCQRVDVAAAGENRVARDRERSRTADSLIECHRRGLERDAARRLGRCGQLKRVGAADGIVDDDRRRGGGVADNHLRDRGVGDAVEVIVEVGGAEDGAVPGCYTGHRRRAGAAHVGAAADVLDGQGVRRLRERRGNGNACGQRTNHEQRPQQPASESSEHLYSTPAHWRQPRPGFYVRRV